MSDPEQDRRTKLRLRLAVGVAAAILVAVLGLAIALRLRATGSMLEEAIRMQGELAAATSRAIALDRATELYREERRVIDAEDSELRRTSGSDAFARLVEASSGALACPAPPAAPPVLESAPEGVAGLRIRQYEIEWNETAPCLPALIEAIVSGPFRGRLALLRADGAKRTARFYWPVASAPPAVPPPSESGESLAPLLRSAAETLNRAAERTRGGALSRLRASGLLEIAVASARNALRAASSIEEGTAEVARRRAELDRYRQWFERVRTTLESLAPSGAAPIVRALEGAKPVSWTLEGTPAGLRIQAEYAPRDFERTLASLDGFRLSASGRKGRFLEATLVPAGPAPDEPHRN